jgi:hypothetical protein
MDQHSKEDEKKEINGDGSRTDSSMIQMAPSTSKGETSKNVSKKLEEKYNPLSLYSSRQREKNPVNEDDKQYSHMISMKNDHNMQNFSQLCNSMYDLLFVQPLRPNRTIESTDLPQKLKEFTRILIEEEEHQAAGILKTDSCLEYALQHHVFNMLCEAAGHDQPIGTTKEILRTFTLLVSRLNYCFLAQTSVYTSLMRLIEASIGNTALSARVGKYIVELMLTICIQFKFCPDLLTIFFHDVQQSSRSVIGSMLPENIKRSKSLRRPTAITFDKEAVAHDISSQISAMVIKDATVDTVAVYVADVPLEHSSEKKDSETLAESDLHYDFPLFQYLLHFIERLGTTGELAKAGLLCCIEVSTEAVSQYIVETSGLCDVVVSGLCNMYSQLSKKSLGEDQWIAQNVHENAIFAGIASHLEFCQLILRKADPIVCKAMLTTIKSKFVEDHLCSDIYSKDQSLDIVLRHINDMLLILSEENLSRLFISSLLSWGQPSCPESNMEQRRPIVEILLEALKLGDTPLKLNVLRLFFVILSSHYSISFLYIHRLICEHDWRKVEISNADKMSSLSSSSSPYELQRFFQLLNRNEFYTTEVDLDMYITDAEQTISFRLEKLMMACDRQLEIKNKVPPPPRYSYRHPYVLLDLLLDELANFIENTMEMNLVLTGLISQIAMCPDPFTYNLLYHRDLYRKDELEHLFGIDVKHTSLYVCLAQLVDRCSELAQTLPEFDKQLEEEYELLNSTRRLETDMICSTDTMTVSEQEQQSRLHLARRMVLLEEFIKEMVAILQIHIVQLYHQPIPMKEAIDDDVSLNDERSSKVTTS